MHMQNDRLELYACLRMLQRELFSSSTTATAAIITSSITTAESVQHSFLLRDHLLIVFVSFMIIAQKVQQTMHT
jgi:hypothetical protein